MADSQEVYEWLNQNCPKDMPRIKEVPHWGARLMTNSQGGIIGITQVRDTGWQFPDDLRAAAMLFKLTWCGR